MDREKIIKGLECCLRLDSPCEDCPYYSYEDIQELDCERNLRHDAIDYIIMVHPDEEAMAKRDAFLSDENGEKLNKALQSLWGDD